MEARPLQGSERQHGVNSVGDAHYIQKCAYPHVYKAWLRPGFVVSVPITHNRRGLGKRHVSDGTGRSELPTRALAARGLRKAPSPLMHATLGGYARFVARGRMEYRNW